MLLKELGALPWFPLVERVELLGAIYGDGCIGVRGKFGRKISVAVSDELPSWLERTRELFNIVFGRCYERRRPRRGSGWNYEFHVTTHDIAALFGIESKYASDGQMSLPGWIEHPELLHHFIRGLIETDGSFKARDKEAVLTNGRNADFNFSQKDKRLAVWLWSKLVDRGYDALFIEASTGMHQVSIRRREHIKRLGEWIDSLKWKELISGGYSPRPTRINRKTGKPVVSRPAQKPKSLSDEEWQRWRYWRRQGASYVAIGRHVGRSNSVVQGAVGDIVPEYELPAEDLGLKPQARRPRPSRVPPDEVEQWRLLALTGISARKIACHFDRRQGEVQEACADIRWDLRMKKRAAQKTRLTEEP